MQRAHVAVSSVALPKTVEAFGWILETERIEWGTRIEEEGRNLHHEKHPPGPRFFMLADHERLKPIKGQGRDRFILAEWPKNAVECKHATGG